MNGHCSEAHGGAGCPRDQRARWRAPFSPEVVEIDRKRAYARDSRTERMIVSTRGAKLHSDALTVMGKDPGGRSVPGLVDRPKDAPSDIRIATTSPLDVGDGVFRAIAEQSSDLMMIADR
jgi:hypothetical protein